MMALLFGVLLSAHSGWAGAGEGSVSVFFFWAFFFVHLT